MSTSNGTSKAKVRKFGDGGKKRDYPKAPVLSNSKTGRYIRKIVDSTPVEFDQCIEWPFSRFQTGYGQVRVGRIKMTAHALVLMLKTSGKPCVDMEAAHECGNRPCVNPNHLKWKTKCGNAKDRVRHGTQCMGETSGTAKLTDKSVIAMREMRVAGRPFTEIARAYSVTREAARSAIIGDTWAHVEDQIPSDVQHLKLRGPVFFSKLSRKDIRAIVARLCNGEVQRVIAEDYGVSQSSISNILRGKTWVGL